MRLHIAHTPVAVCAPPRGAAPVAMAEATHLQLATARPSPTSPPAAAQGFARRAALAVSMRPRLSNPPVERPRRAPAKLVTPSPATAAQPGPNARGRATPASYDKHRSRRPRQIREGPSVHVRLTSGGNGGVRPPQLSVIAGRRGAPPEGRRWS